jgi:hypothetical protein
MHMHDPDSDDPEYATLAARDFCRDAVGHGCFAIDLDGAVQAFVPSVRDRLIERGVLTQDTDTVWHLRWHGFDLDREKAADMACCDFCSARPVTWLIPCESFAMPSLPGLPLGQSQGDWAACEPCGAAIDARDAAGLLTRALAVPLPTKPIDVSHLRQTLLRLKRTLHRRFWQHYRGGALRLPAHPYGH